MRLLLISPAELGGYSAALTRNVERALARIGASSTRIAPSVPVEDHRGYDLYVGVGDEIFRKNPALVRRIRAIGGRSADFRTRFLPRKPVRWLLHAVGLGKDQPDYAFTHFHTWHPRGLYVGQGVNDDLLYPEHDETFTVYVDHFMRSRRSFVQHILDQCAELHRRRGNVRVWYHTADGIAENRFTEDRQGPKVFPFEALAAYYRKTHVFLPTHRETQGMVAAEIGMCGGLTLLMPWMYPYQRARQIPHRFYLARIHWPETVDVAANRAKAKAEFGIEVFTARLKTALDVIGRDAGPPRRPSS
jgi:hypothetical protein